MQAADRVEMTDMVAAKVELGLSRYYHRVLHTTRRTDPFPEATDPSLRHIAIHK